MAGDEAQRLTTEGDGSDEEPEVKVRFADRTCPRCHTKFVASYYRGEDYVKSRCLDCMLFWPTPLMA